MRWNVWVSVFRTMSNNVFSVLPYATSRSYSFRVCILYTHVWKPSEWLHQPSCHHYSDDDDDNASTPTNEPSVYLPACPVHAVPWQRIQCLRRQRKHRHHHHHHQQQQQHHHSTVHYYLPHSYNSTEQIIKSVCVSAYAYVRLCALSRSHFLINFHENGTEVNTPKSKNELGLVNTVPFLPIFCPQAPF